jgi:nickel transport protein
VKYSGMIILLVLMVFIGRMPLYAHGVKGAVREGGLVVTARYDTDEAMSYAKVRISAPGAKLAFQTGRTDRNGRFCFFPDVPGDWKVLLDDEMGHRLDVNVPVNEQLVWREKEQPGETSKSTFCRYEKALMGVCIIFGGCGVLFWWRGKKGRARLET